MVDASLWKDVRCEGAPALNPAVETAGYKIIDVFEL
jgi:hypothetical protein